MFNKSGAILEATSPHGAKAAKRNLYKKKNPFVPPGLGRVSQQTLMTRFREALVQLGLGGQHA